MSLRMLILDDENMRFLLQEIFSTFGVPFFLRIKDVSIAFKFLMSAVPRVSNVWHSVLGRPLYITVS